MYKQFVVIFLLIFIISHSVSAQSALYHTFSDVEMAVTDFGAFAAILGGSLAYNFRYPASEENSVSYLHPYSEIWIGDFDYCPVLTIRTDDLDFVHRPRHLEIIIQRIHDKLAGKEEVEFPSE